MSLKTESNAGQPLKSLAMFVVIFGPNFLVGELWQTVFLIWTGSQLLGAGSCSVLLGGPTYGPLAGALPPDKNSGELGEKSSGGET